MKPRFVMNLVVTLGLASSLFAADPFVGTWKPNGAKPKLAGPNPARLTEETIVDEKGTETVTEQLTAADGSPISIKFTNPTTRGPVQFLEGAQPGVSFVIAKRSADSHIVDATGTKDGKVILTAHTVVSADGKSKRTTLKSIDAQGKTFESVVVMDKQ